MRIKMTMNDEMKQTDLSDADTAEKTVLPDSDDSDDSAVSAHTADPVESLRAECDRLRSLVRGYEAETARREELDEFASLYPDVELTSLPDEVRESKLPLAAAWALWERRHVHMHVQTQMQMHMQSAGKETNGGIAAAVSASEGLGSPPLSPSGQPRLYTVGEIRAMSPREVRSRFPAILRSLARRGQ